MDEPQQNPAQPLTTFRREGPTQEHEDRAQWTLKRDQFLRRAKERFRTAFESEQLQRKRSIEEVDFNSGNHWDPDMRRAREEADRVVLEVNRTPQFLNQVANEQRMTRPQIIVRPTGSGADTETADVKQGIIRATERRYQAEEIRDDCFYAMLEKGWSYYRIIEGYESEKSFRRVFKPVKIEDDFAVYCDPAAFGRVNAKFYFITDDMPVEEFKATYPDSELAGLDDFASLGNEQKFWIGNGTIRVAEYYYTVDEPIKLYAFADDQNKYEDELTDEDQATMLRDEKGNPITRMTTRQSVYWCKMSAKDVLDGNEDKSAGRKILGQHIPIIPVLGRKVRVEGRYIYCGMVRDAIQPCLASDYWLSAITEMVALAPKAPWIAAYKAIQRYKEMWDSANIENWSALYYDHIDESGQPLPAPSRNFGEPPIQALTFILNYADEDLKRVMGIYNAALGAPSAESSGVAIGKRQNESDVANYNYIDNLKRSIAYEARVYLSLMKDVLVAEQAIEMVRPDGKSEQVLINQMFPDKSTGENKMFNMVTGDYDVEVEVGPSYNTRRQEAADGMIQFLKIDPTAAPLIGDLLVQNQDYPNKDQMIERLKMRAAQIAPGIVQDDDNDQAKIPPKFLAQYQQQSQMLEALEKQLQQMNQLIGTKTIEHQHQMELKAMELASQERQASFKGEVSVVIAEMAKQSKADLAMITAGLNQVQKDIEAFRQPGPVEYTLGPGGQLLPPGAPLPAPGGQPPALPPSPQPPPPAQAAA